MSYRSLSTTSTVASLFQRYVRPVWVLWVILILGIVESPRFLQHYYDYYIAEINSQLLISVWLDGFFFFGLIASFTNKLRFSDKSFTILILGISVILFLLSLFSTLPRASQQLQALIYGPGSNIGVVQDKRWDSIARSGMVYYVDIDGKHFETPDSDWYKVIQVGEELEYVYSPFVTVLTPEVFDPQKSGFSAIGIAVALGGYFLWLLVTLFSVDGWLTMLKRFRDRRKRSFLVKNHPSKNKNPHR